MFVSLSGIPPLHVLLYPHFYPFTTPYISSRSEKRQIAACFICHLPQCERNSWLFGLLSFSMLCYIRFLSSCCPWPQNNLAGINVPSIISSQNTFTLGISTNFCSSFQFQLNYQIHWCTHTIYLPFDSPLHRPWFITVGVFPTGGHTNKWICMRVSLSQMVMQKDTRIYLGSGKRRPYVQRGGESLYYFALKCLYRGEYKRGMEYGSSTAYECSVA